MSYDRLLVLGGTGFLGRSVVARLVDHHGGAGGRILVPTRRVHHGHELLALPTVDVERCDLHDDVQLQRLVAGCDAVINLVGVLHGGPAAFEQAHVALPRRLALACAMAGVRRVVHVSALGVGANPPSLYLRSKAAGEAVLREAGLDLTVLRPSVMFGEHDHFLNLFARLQAVLPVVPLAGAQARFQPVWVEDVAEAIVRSLERRDSIGAVIECAGPQVFTLRELVRLAGRWSGHRRPVLGLPDGLARLQAMLMELAPGEPLLSRDNLDSMRVPNVAGDGPGLASLGIQPTALAAVAPAYLGSERGPTEFDRFRAAARRG